jgi:ribonuclease HI
MIQLTDGPQETIEIRKYPITTCEDPPSNASIWKMFFNGASSKEGAEVGVFFISPTQETISLSYNLEFETKNNVVEYESLFLSMRASKDMKIEELAVFGDAKLIVHQVRNLYQDKHPRCGILLTVSSWILISHLFQEGITLWKIHWVSQQAILESLYPQISSMRWK